MLGRGKGGKRREKKGREGKEKGGEGREKRRGMQGKRGMVSKSAWKGGEKGRAVLEFYK